MNQIVETFKTTQDFKDFLQKQADKRKITRSALIKAVLKSTLNTRKKRFYEKEGTESKCSVD